MKKVRNDREKKGDEAVMTLLTPREKVARSGRRRPRTAPAHVLTPTELGYDEVKGKLFYNVSFKAQSNVFFWKHCFWPCFLKVLTNQETLFTVIFPEGEQLGNIVS